MLPLDWTRPVAQIQTALGNLRLAKIRQFKWLMLLAPLMGFCLFIAGLHWTLERVTADRVNVLDHFNLWIVSNYVFGVLFVPLGYLAAQILASQCHRRAWWQSLLDDISGKTLNTTAKELDRWSALQNENANRQL